MTKENKEISKYYVFEAAICWLITVLWMILIYKLSDESGTESTVRTSSVLLYFRMIIGKQIFSEFLIRKMAHMIEFSVLTIFSFLAIRATNKISVKTSYAYNPVKFIKSDNEVYIVFALWFCTFYAIIDEYHQLFITGRSGSIYDVLIDLVGILITLIIIRIIFHIYLKRLGKREVRYD